MHAPQVTHTTPHRRRNKVDDQSPTGDGDPTQLKSTTPDSMEVECMIACMRKLAIWYTPNFKPIITHDDLDHIMSTLGFLPLPPTTTPTTLTLWKEYSFPSAGALLSDSPRPRLPYPRIDGLHVNTYRSFLDSIDFYLRRSNITDLFHIRGMPLHHAHDRRYKWLRIGDDLVYVYREGTMDMPTGYKNVEKDKKPVSHIVPWKNIMDNGQDTIVV